MNRDFGEVPGYEFEAPRARPGGHGRGALPGAGDPLRALRSSPGQRPASADERRLPADDRPAPSPVRLTTRVLRIMRGRSLVTNLAVPVVAAITVGITAVVVVGGGGTGGTAATSALADGFPPARLAGADFSGPAGGTQVILAAVAASAGTDVVAGSAAAGPALWVSANGGSAWRRPALAGPTALTRAGSGQLTGVTHGAAGWLAVGNSRNGTPGPILASSPGGRTWSVTRLSAAPGAVAVATAAGPAGYVIVGHRPAGAGTAAAWYARSLAGWRPAAVAGRAPAGTAAMSAVAATARGFIAVGSSGPGPAAWLSASGRSWRPVAVPLPAGAQRAALDYVAADGGRVVAAGTGVFAAGVSRPFTAISGDAGATWTLRPLPAPPGGTAATAVTALTAAGHGFIAAGTYNAAGGTDVAVWTLPSGSVAGGAWTVVTPQGTGLAGPGTQALTALTAQGATLTGVGFTAMSASRPTLWQSPIRY